MSIKLNRAGFDHAVKLIKQKLEVEHDQGNWQAVKATPDEEAKYLQTHSLEEYGLWFLGIDEEIEPQGKHMYTYPYGDLKVLHKSALITVIQQATQHHVHEIKQGVL